MSTVVSTVLSLSGWWAYAVIGLIAFGEAAAFVGLFLPGETALLLGGVLAAAGRISLHGPAPVEVTTDKAAPYLRVLDELVRPQRMSPSSTATTRSKPITAGWKPGSRRCAAQNASDQLR